MNKRFHLGLQNFKFDEAEVTHINKMPFSGTVAFVDTPSDGSPCGAMGKKVIFPKEAVEKAIESFVGMGVNCVYDDRNTWNNPEDCLTGHDERFKIGIVECAGVEGNAVQVSGFLWRYDFGDVCKMIKNAKDSLGFSVEIVANAVEEYDNHLLVTELIFTGIAILYADCGAFKQTRLVAKRSDMMNEEQIRTLLAEAVQAVEVKFTESLNAANAKVEELTAQLADANTKVEGIQAQGEMIEAVKTDNEAIKAEAEVVKVENAELKEKLESISLELADVKASKQDKVPERKSMQFNTLSKYGGEDKTVDIICKEISEDKELTSSQKWSLKLQAWKKEQAE